MNPQKLAIHISISLICALAVIAIYHLFFTTQIKIIESKVDAHNLSFDEYLYSGKVFATPPEEFHSSFVDVAAKSRKAVVYILAYERIQNQIFKKGFKREKGSGVIVSREGHIVTNCHVIERASHIEITLNNKKEYLAEVIGTDPSTDLALLKIEASGLPFLIFGNSDRMNVGEWVLAVGNPFGLQSTVTAGIVSAKARSLAVADYSNNIESLIQSDVVINPGSSGGALLNQYGELMGINTAIISASGNYEGISFAIPANIASKVIFDLKQFGAVQRAKMGITLRDVDANLADLLKMDEIKGVFVATASFNGAAHEAGIRRGDVILKINNREVNTTPEFTEKLNEFRPGDNISIEFVRKNSKRKTEVLLKNHLNTTDFVAIKNNSKLRFVGIEIRNLNSTEKDRMNIEGVYVVSVSKGSPAEKSNMEPGFIIERVNNQKVRSDQDLIRLLDSTKTEVRFEGFYERYPGKFPYEIDLR